MRRRVITLLFLTSASALACSAASRAEEVTDLDLITVTVNKVKQAFSDALGGVSVVTKKEAELQADTKISDIVAPMPGVSTAENADDPASAINIRGLQDFGRVVVTVDGARQNFQRSGHNANGTFYFEPEMLKQVTVVRGPVSNVNGSGAIGGVVSFETMDALSFLRDGENAAISEKLRYSSNGDGFLSNTTGAVRMGEYGGILGSLVYRDSGNYEDGAGTTVPSSGQEIIAGLVKGTIKPADGHLLNLSYLVNKDRFENGITTVLDNEVTAETFAAKYEWDGNGNPLFDLTASAYWTATDQDQERLTGPDAGTSRLFSIDTYGTDIYNTSRFTTGTIKNTLTIGGDFFQDDVFVRDPAGTSDLFTPSGLRTVGGAFIQNQMELTPWLEFTAAGRFDAYRLEGGGLDSEGARFSPKGTVVLKPFVETSLSGLNFYATYAEGYRAPSITETLINGSHPPPALFTFLPNPNLRPETAHNIEGGLTGSFQNVLAADDSLTMRAGAFRNNVSDYIGGVFEGTTYQYQNIADATLWGLEVEANYDRGWFFAGIAGSLIRGDDNTTDEPLATVPADKLVTTLGFRFLDEKATAGVRWFAVAGQDRVPRGSPTSEAYHLVNLFSTYQWTDSITVGFNVENLFDENYRSFLDASNSPGRTFLFTLSGRLGG